ncbi:MAG: DMT family transporter [Alphaproteobacteria bacterium]|nr:DMT family transporter [Alphaproteobacteria bacterium]
MTARAAAGPVLVALAVMVVWGTTPVATRLAVLEVDPFVVALARTVIGGAVAIPLALLMGIRPPRGRRTITLVLLAGFSGFVGFPLLYNVGQQMTSALHGSLILAGMPVLTGLYAALADRARPKRRWLAGCAVAVAGEALLIGARGPDAGSASLIGDLIIVASALIVPVGYVLGARATQSGFSSLGTTLWGLGAGALVLAPALAIKLAVSGPPGGGMAAWGATVWLAIVTSILGYIGWYWALARGGIQRIAVMQFLQPVSGLVLAILLLGEQPSLTLAAAAALIIGGIVIAQRR